MVASERQIVVYDTWKFTDSNILIQAVAGSGKTTTLIEILKMCEYKTLFLAFNKSIQTEIQSIIDEQNIKQGKALTIHSLGLTAIRNVTKFRINKNKNFDIIKKIQDEYSDIFRRFTWEDKVKLSYTLMDLLDTTKLFLSDDIEEVSSHMLDMDKIFFDLQITDINGNNLSFVKFIWRRLLEIRDDYYNQPVMEIDFNDMIYVPVIKNMHIPVNPYYLMIDKCFVNLKPI